MFARRPWLSLAITSTRLASKHTTMLTWCAYAVVGQYCFFDRLRTTSWSSRRGFSAVCNKLNIVKSTLCRGERSRLNILYKPGKEVYIQYIQPTTSKGWRQYTPWQSTLKQAGASQRASLNDWPRSRLGSIKKLVLTYNCTSTSCKRGCVLRCKPSWHRHTRFSANKRQGRFV